jgi:hypothetical protein
MARRTPRAGIGEYLYRLYTAAYFLVLAFALLGDINGTGAHVVAVTQRASAFAGAAVGALTVAFALSGYRAVALRPTPAETQLALLSPTPRTATLARATAFSASSVAIAGAFATVGLMLASPFEFGGLGVGRQLGYVACAAGVSVAAFGAHLLVAERRARSFTIAAGAALAALSVVDIVTNRGIGPLTTAVETLRTGPAAVVVIGSWLLATALVGISARGAERLPMELIARGANVADRATFAIAGNDLRSLLLLQRSLGAQAWRTRPLFRLSRRAGRQRPVMVRAIRCIARWRYGRWLTVLAAAAGASALLTVPRPTLRTLALAAVVLWAAGLVLGEPFAQENDRADRLVLLPAPRRLEAQHVLISWTLTFVLLSVTLLAAPWVHVAVISSIALAVAGASAAMCAATITYRHKWALVANPAMVGMDPYGGIGGIIIVKVLWPAIVACVSLLGVRAGAPAAPAALCGGAVFGLTLLWLTMRGPAL